MICDSVDVAVSAKPYPYSLLPCDENDFHKQGGHIECKRDELHYNGLGHSFL